MSNQASRRSAMVLYTAANDIDCHLVRMALAEKGLAAEWIVVPPGQTPEAVYEVNPYGSLPTLIDRDFSLYQTDILLNYLDERFPHPALLPVFPMERSQTRLMMYRIRRDWFSLADKILQHAPDANEARHDLREGLLAIAPLFREMPYFMAQEFGLLDMMMAALLWRLPRLSIELTGPGSKELHSYMVRLFERDGFLQSLTEAERRIRFD